jgi:hypothetical protein
MPDWKVKRRERKGHYDLTLQLDVQRSCLTSGIGEKARGQGKGAFGIVIFASEEKSLDVMVSPWPHKADSRSWWCELGRKSADPGRHGIILAGKGKSLDLVVSSWTERPKARLVARS